MVHNGHIHGDAVAELTKLSPNFPLLTLAPHVTKYLSGRLGNARPPEWVLPIYPYNASRPCTLQELQKVGCSCAGTTRGVGSKTKGLIIGS